MPYYTRRPSKRTVRRAIKRSSVKVDGEAVMQAHGNSGISKLQPVLLDAYYWAISREALELFLQWSRVDKPSWEEDRRDCDNFAAALFGQVSLHFNVNPIVLIWDWSGAHAYNAVLLTTDDGGLEIVVIEPQTDGTVSIGESLSTSEIYAATSGVAVYG